MQFFKAKDYFHSWSVWVLSAITVTPILDANLEVVANLLPDNWKPYFITGLGIIGLIAKAIKQKPVK